MGFLTHLWTQNGMTKDTSGSIEATEVFSRPQTALSRPSTSRSTSRLSKRRDRERELTNPKRVRNVSAGGIATLFKPLWWWLALYHSLRFLIDLALLLAIHACKVSLSRLRSFTRYSFGEVWKAGFRYGYSAIFSSYDESIGQASPIPLSVELPPITSQGQRLPLFASICLRQRLLSAQNYNEWYSIKKYVDRLTGLTRLLGESVWGSDGTERCSVSVEVPDVDAKRLRSQTQMLRDARARNDIDTLSTLIGASVGRNFCGIKSSDLYTISPVDTKGSVKAFLFELITSLRHLSLHHPNTTFVDSSSGRSVDPQAVIRSPLECPNGYPIDPKVNVLGHFYDIPNDFLGHFLSDLKEDGVFLGVNGSGEKDGVSEGDSGPLSSNGAVIGGVEDTFGDGEGSEGPLRALTTTFSGVLTSISTSVSTLFGGEGSGSDSLSPKNVDKISPKASHPTDPSLPQMSQFHHKMSQNPQKMSQNPRIQLRNATLKDTIARYRLTHGRTAMAFSGGGALALAHVGVLKTLWDAGCFPNVISGTSGGSITAAIVGTRTDEELGALLTPLSPSEREKWTQLGVKRRVLPFLDIVQIKRVAPPFSEQWKNFQNCGYMIPHQPFCDYIYDLVGNMTFAEAFQRTGRYISITTVPSGEVVTSEPLCCNAINTPDVYVWSAVTASCALPLVLPPTYLYSRGKVLDLDDIGNDNSTSAIKQIHYNRYGAAIIEEHPSSSDGGQSTSIVARVAPMSQKQQRPDMSQKNVPKHGTQTGTSVFKSPSLGMETPNRNPRPYSSDMFLKRQKSILKSFDDTEPLNNSIRRGMKGDEEVGTTTPPRPSDTPSASANVRSNRRHRSGGASPVRHQRLTDYLPVAEYYPTGQPHGNAELGSEMNESAIDLGPQGIVRNNGDECPPSVPPSSDVFNNDPCSACPERVSASFESFPNSLAEPLSYIDSGPPSSSPSSRLKLTPGNLNRISDKFFSFNSYTNHSNGYSNTRHSVQLKRRLGDTCPNPNRPDMPIGSPHETPVGPDEGAVKSTSPTHPSQSREEPQMNSPPTRDGNIRPRPYNLYNDGMRFVDGSILQDIPTEELQTSFNVKYVIVSQVNPHFIPFISGPSDAKHELVIHENADEGLSDSDSESDSDIDSIFENADEIEANESNLREEGEEAEGEDGFEDALSMRSSPIRFSSPPRKVPHFAQMSQNSKMSQMSQNSKMSQMGDKIGDIFGLERAVAGWIGESSDIPSPNQSKDSPTDLNKFKIIMSQMSQMSQIPTSNTPINPPKRPPRRRQWPKFKVQSPHIKPSIPHLPAHSVADRLLNRFWNFVTDAIRYRYGRLLLCSLIPRVHGQDVSPFFEKLGIGHCTIVPLSPLDFWKITRPMEGEEIDHLFRISCRKTYPYVFRLKMKLLVEMELRRLYEELDAENI